MNLTPTCSICLLNWGFGSNLKSFTNSAGECSILQSGVEAVVSFAVFWVDLKELDPFSSSIFFGSEHYSSPTPTSL